MRKNPVASHPVTSAVIGLLIIAVICGALIVPIYARVTPRIGDFPFFYFYLLAYMPVTALALWIVSLLQRGLHDPDAGTGGGGTGGGAEAEAEAAR